MGGFNPPLAYSLAKSLTVIFTCLISRALGGQVAAFAGDEFEPAVLLGPNLDGLRDAYGFSTVRTSPFSFFSSMCARTLEPGSTSIFEIGTVGVFRSLI